MIAFIAGRLDETSADSAVIDCNGVGYRALCSAKTLATLPERGTPCRLYTELQIREDAHVLYGFASTEEQYWFRTLNSVQGVGGKAALAVLSVLTPEDIIAALAAEDKAAFQRADGVGAKLALRLVTELKDKAAHYVSVASMPLKTSKTHVSSSQAAASDAVSALVNLGYARVQAYTAVQQAAVETAANDTASLVTLALRSLAATG